MKNNMINTIFVMAVILFVSTACINENINDPDIIGDVLELYNKPVKYFTGTVDLEYQFFDDSYYPLSDYIAGEPEVKINKGFLTLKLGTPRPEKMSLCTTIGFDDSITVKPDDANFFALCHFASLDKFTLYFDKYYNNMNDYESIKLFFVDKDVTILGSTDHSVYNVYLKQGWNFLLYT